MQQEEAVVSVSLGMAARPAYPMGDRQDQPDPERLGELLLGGALETRSTAA